ncbi:MAG: thiol protease/hemagglutinin PrtT [Bacteroidales bacterium]|nr:thiol protease/hemagglutinin PrtT [Bacteroidales bacterium]
MKRILLVLALLSCGLSMKANPVGLEEARSLGQLFVRANFEFSRQSSELTLVYALPSFYIFNVGESGFVILSADDYYRPVIGYSDEGVFDPNDMAPALQEYLDNINEGRMRHNVGAASMEIAQDWKSIRASGRLVSRHGGKASTYLVSTKWNQNYPYNYCCPADPAGPGGHVYAGCVATAAAQLMKFWNHPLHGTGSHTYTPEDNPQYGPITVNFGNATYDWDNMPNTISSASPIEQIEAIGQLIFHAGVSVDMNYRPTSSGAVTGMLCEVMPEHFFYTDQMRNLYRENYTKEDYLAMIFRSIDMGWPMVHRGGGHAYVLDGYNDYGFVHFNWGWGGSNDSWFDIDDHNYTDGESVIYNYVPAEIYAATPDAPTNLAATAAANNELAVEVTWTNPSVTLTNQVLTAIDQIVVMRGEEIVYTNDNVTPGEAMSFVDHTIPCFDSYDYTVYAITNGQRGRSTSIQGINVGPTCTWKYVVSSTNFQGWCGAYIAVYNASGTKINQVTINSSTPDMLQVEMPLGFVSLAWVPAEASPSFDITINVKDADNTSVFSYTGNINAMEEGIFFEGNNGCGASADCGTPSNLTATQDENTETTIHLNWTGVQDPGYGYVIYRDSVLVRLIVDGATSFDDVNVPVGGHCYQVATLCDGGMSGEASNMYCEPSGACHAPRQLDYELTANYKCNLKWELPEPSEGLSGYMLYRSSDLEEFKLIDMLNPNVTSHIDKSVKVEGDYYYKLVAYYGGLDCYSAPAAYKYDPNQYYLHFYYSITGTGENNADSRIYPNPTSGMLKVELEQMRLITVYNILGQNVYEKQVNGDEATINLKSFGSGVYLVKIETAEGVVTKRISLIDK